MMISRVAWLVCSTFAALGAVSCADTSLDEEAVAVGEAPAALGAPTGTCYLAKGDRPKGDCIKGRWEFATGLTLQQCADSTPIIDATVDFQALCDAWYPMRTPNTHTRAEICWEDSATLVRQRAFSHDHVCP